MMNIITLTNETVDPIDEMMFQRLSAAGMNMSMKNSNDTIGNRTRDLSACSEVPQPSVPPRAPALKAQSDEMMKRTSTPKLHKA